MPPKKDRGPEFSPRTQREIAKIQPVLEAYNYTPQDTKRLIVRCEFDPARIQNAVANVLEDRKNHEQGDWGCVLSKKQKKEAKAEAERKEAEELEALRAEYRAEMAAKRQAAWEAEQEERRRQRAEERKRQKQAKGEKGKGKGRDRDDGRGDRGGRDRDRGERAERDRGDQRGGRGERGERGGRGGRDREAQDRTRNRPGRSDDDNWRSGDRSNPPTDPAIVSWETAPKEKGRRERRGRREETWTQGEFTLEEIEAKLTPQKDAPEAEDEEEWGEEYGGDEAYEEDQEEENLEAFEEDVSHLNKSPAASGGASAGTPAGGLAQMHDIISQMSAKLPPPAALQPTPAAPLEGADTRLPGLGNAMNPLNKMGAQAQAGRQPVAGMGGFQYGQSQSQQQMAYSGGMGSQMMQNGMGMAAMPSQYSAGQGFSQGQSQFGYGQQSQFQGMQQGQGFREQGQGYSRGFQYSPGQASQATQQNFQYGFAQQGQQGYPQGQQYQFYSSR